ncbi:MAG: hypothetical protein ABFD50_18465 [Smithella sp.]
MHDLIVIGDDLSSYVAAAMAANYGLDTVLVARHGTGGVCLIGNLAFNIDPRPLSGFGALQTCLALLAELDIPPIEQAGRLLNPAYQIILPEQRIDFYNEKEELINELIREFPIYAEEIKAFYNSEEKKCRMFTDWLQTHPFIQPQDTKDYYDFLKIFLPQLVSHQIEKIKLKSLLNRNASLKKIFEAQNLLLGYTIDNKFSFSSSFQYCTPFRGIYSFEQGKQHIFNSLIKKLEMKNGSYLNGFEVVSIKQESSIEIKIVDKAGNSSIISAKKLIVSTISEGMPLLPAANKNFNFEYWINPVYATYVPFTIHISCNWQCFPERMARHSAVVLDVEKEIFDNNIIILELHLSEDVSIRAAESAALTATVFLPNNEEVWSRENLLDQASSIIEHLEFFLPFLKENINFFDLEKSIEISRNSRSAHSPKYKMRNSFLTGFAARTNKTCFKNIFLTGASLSADIGFEGEIISGINAATRVIPFSNHR